MEKTLTTNVAINLKQLLKEKKITQRELSKQLGCAYSLIGFYIRGERRPSVDIFFQMCKILQVSPVELAKDFGLDVSDIPDDN